VCCIPRSESLATLHGDGIPLRADVPDQCGQPQVREPVVVDEVFAHRYWPQGNAVGQRVFSIPRKPDDSNVYTVVGVVGAVKQIDLTEADGTGTVYFPYIYTFSRNYFLGGPHSLPPELLGDTLRRVVSRPTLTFPHRPALDGDPHRR